MFGIGTTSSPSFSVSGWVMGTYKANITTSEYQISSVLWEFMNECRMALFYMLAATTLLCHLERPSNKIEFKYVGGMELDGTWEQCAPLCTGLMAVGIG